MTFYAIIDQIKAITQTYTGDRLGFGYGTYNECNAIADPILPLVWVLTDIDAVQIQPNFKNNTKSITFSFIVLDSDKVDSPANLTRPLHEQADSIGNGIIYRLIGNEEITYNSSANTFKSKILDNGFSGVLFKVSLTVPDLVCEYPFEETEE